MEQPAPLDDSALLTCAQRAKLDIERFEADRADPALDDRVDRDIALAEVDGVRGTPWYVLDGEAAGPLRSLAAKLRPSSAGSKPAGGPG